MIKNGFFMLPILLLGMSTFFTFYFQSIKQHLHRQYNVMSNAMQRMQAVFYLQAQRNKEKKSMITVGE